MPMPTMEIDHDDGLTQMVESLAFEIRGALARGYCSERNGSKILDGDLIEDMAIEIEKLLRSRGIQVREYKS